VDVLANINLFQLTQNAGNFFINWASSFQVANLQLKLNLLEPEFYIQILAHSVGKMRIIQEPNKVAL